MPGILISIIQQFSVTLYESTGVNMNGINTSNIPFADDTALFGCKKLYINIQQMTAILDRVGLYDEWSQAQRKPASW